MRIRDWLWLAAALPIAAARNVRADFDPHEASRHAVAHFHLEARVERARLLCDADLVHSGGFAAGFVAGVADRKTRETLENVCALVYAGSRATATTLAYSLLSTPVAKDIAKLDAAIEVILDMPPRGD